MYFTSKQLSFSGNGNPICDGLYMYFLGFNSLLCFNDEPQSWNPQVKNKTLMVEAQCVFFYTLKVRSHYVILTGHAVFKQGTETERISRQDYRKLSVRSRKSEPDKLE